MCKLPASPESAYYSDDEKDSPNNWHHERHSGRRPEEELSNAKKERRGDGFDSNDMGQHQAPPCTRMQYPRVQAHKGERNSYHRQHDRYADREG